MSPLGYATDLYQPNERCLVSVDDALNPSNELGYFGVNSWFMWKTTSASKRRDSCLHPMIVDETDERSSRVSLQSTNQLHTYTVQYAFLWTNCTRIPPSVLVMLKNAKNI